MAYSVGVVGLKEQIGEIELLRRELSAEVYLWVNAYKRKPDYYSNDEIRALSTVAPLFRFNTRHHPSKGKACRTGSTVFSVDGDGTMRRCRFVKEAIGNIYMPGFEDALQPAPCSNDLCGCHIGYVHLEELDLYSVFGEGVLERIPAGYHSQAREMVSRITVPTGVQKD